MAKKPWAAEFPPLCITYLGYIQRYLWFKKNVHPTLTLVSIKDKLLSNREFYYAGHSLMFMDRLHWRHLLAITPVTATNVFTCLGYLGQYDGQGKYIQRDNAGVIVCDIALNIANVNSALRIF